MTKAIRNWRLLILLFIPAINVHAGPLPDTGQTKCYNNSEEILCPAPGEAFYGQDGNYLINPPSYTKLDASGNALADAAETWAMIRDNITGLIWENKTGDGSIHDGSKTFTWCDRNPATNDGYQGSCGTGTGSGATDTEAFLKALNDGRFGGFPDWRLPNIDELQSIVAYGRYTPIDAAVFPNTMTSYYWSSTTSANDHHLAWCVSFYSGDVDNGYGSKADAYAVRAVRGGQ